MDTERERRNENSSFDYLWFKSSDLSGTLMPGRHPLTIVPGKLRLLCFEEVATGD